MELSQLIHSWHALAVPLLFGLLPLWHTLKCWLCHAYHCTHIYASHKPCPILLSTKKFDLIHDDLCELHSTNIAIFVHYINQTAMCLLIVSNGLFHCTIYYLCMVCHCLRRMQCSVWCRPVDCLEIFTLPVVVKCTAEFAFQTMHSTPCDACSIVDRLVLQCSISLSSWCWALPIEKHQWLSPFFI